MAISTGKDGDILVGGNSVASIESWTINESAPVARSVPMQASYANKEAGVPEWAGQCTVAFDPADSSGQGAMTVGASLSGAFRPVNGTSGSPEWTGTIIVTGIDTNASPTEFNRQTISFEGNGALTKGTVA